jgi:hypothetical protein
MIIPLPLAKAKNGQKHSYAKKKILTTKKVGIMQQGPCFFLLGRVGVLDFCCSYCVSIVFP